MNKQLLHPWSCYRDENGEVVLSYAMVGHSVTIVGITKQQISSLQKELEAFEQLDSELNQDLEDR